MGQSLTLEGISWRRNTIFLVGIGMAVASVMTIQHFFDTNYPTSIYAGSFCDINAFFNCDSSAYSEIAAIAGVPLGFFGLFLGCVVAMGAVFPSVMFERTNKMINLLNVIGVIVLLSYSVFILGSLCLLCAGYYVFSVLSFVMFWKFGIDKDEKSFLARWFRPSIKHLATFGVMMLIGAYGFLLYHNAKKEAQEGGVSARVVEQYFSLPIIESPSIISPMRSFSSTETFEDAPIQVIEYADFLCPDCLYFYNQMKRLKKEFAGQINVAFQFFPLEAKCNDVVDKDLHPGACELSYMAAHDPSKFVAMHDEIYDNFLAAKKPEWREEFAKRWGVEDALTDEATKDLIHRIIRTGTEYEKNSDKWAHGIRSTPTMIINNRLVIGTFPYSHLRAIFRAIADGAIPPSESKDKKFMEHWVSPTP
jgi:uncharacterized membrane protein/protein-disulfide isomerase